MKKNICIAAGGTGGHIYPALSTADAVSKTANVFFVGTLYGLESTLIPQHGYTFTNINMRQVRGKGLLRLFQTPFILSYAIFQSIKLLKTHKTDLVITFGGYVSAPVGIAAKLLGIPLFIHEQNAAAGLTNRMLAPLSTKIFQAYPKTFNSKKAQTTGNPVRRVFENLPTEPSQTLRFLVLGGSLGASVFAQVVPISMALLHARFPHLHIHIVHQCGKNIPEGLIQQYEKSGCTAQVTHYLDPISTVYAQTDIIISRAGAISCAEIAAVGIPSILVPYPTAADNHQEANAQHLVNADAAIMILQKNFTPHTLADALTPIVQSEHRRAIMRAHAKKMHTQNAADIIARECTAYD